MTSSFSPRAVPFCTIGLLLCAALFGPGRALAAVSPAHDGIHAQIARADALIAEAPEDPSGYLQRGSLHRVHKAWSAALADLDRAAALRSDLPGLAIERGRLLLDVGHLEGAREHLQAAVDAAPADPALLVLRAECHQRQGRNDAALADLDAAIACTRVADPGLYLRRARLAASAGRAGRVDALAGLDAALLRCGPVPVLVHEAIEQEAALGRLQAALARVDAMAAATPHSPEPHAIRARLHERFEQPRQAAGSWRACLQACNALPHSRTSSPAMRALRTLAAARLAAPSPPSSSRSR